MIVTIKQAKGSGTTTTTAIVNLAVGDDSVAISLWPAEQVDGVWKRIEGAPLIPLIGSPHRKGKADLNSLLAEVEKAVEKFVKAKGK